jgi:hypothetical protein
MAWPARGRRKPPHMGASIDSGAGTAVQHDDEF